VDTPFLGYIPQTPALYRELTVADHLDLAARLRPGFDRAAAVERLAALGIPARSRGSELSGGQQAQLTLAVALGTGPTSCSSTSRSRAWTPSLAMSS
jgi:ABC-2 type transport system ATP-binding protein